MFKGHKHLRLQLVAGPLGHAAKVVSGQQVYMRQARLRQLVQVAAPCMLRPRVNRECQHLNNRQAECLKCTPQYGIACSASSRVWVMQTG